MPTATSRRRRRNSSRTATRSATASSACASSAGSTSARRTAASASDSASRRCACSASPPRTAPPRSRGPRRARCRATNRIVHSVRARAHHRAHVPRDPDLLRRRLRRDLRGLGHARRARGAGLRLRLHAGDPDARRVRGRRPATGAAAGALVALASAVLDVLGHHLLERLKLLEELVGRDLGLRVVRPEQPGGRVDGGLPGDLIRGVVVLRGLLACRLDAVQVDVLKPVALLLVEGDTRALPLELGGRLPDLRPERRVLVAVGVAQDVAGVPRARLGLLDTLDLGDALHDHVVPGAQKIARDGRGWGTGTRTPLSRTKTWRPTN